MVALHVCEIASVRCGCGCCNRCDLHAVPHLQHCEPSLKRFPCLICKHKCCVCPMSWISFFPKWHACTQLHIFLASLRISKYFCDVGSQYSSIQSLIWNYPDLTQSCALLYWDLQALCIGTKKICVIGGSLRGPLNCMIEHIRLSYLCICIRLSL